MESRSTKKTRLNINKLSRRSDYEDENESEFEADEDGADRLTEESSSQDDGDGEYLRSDGEGDDENGSEGFGEDEEEKATETDEELPKPSTNGHSKNSASVPKKTAIVAQAGWVPENTSEATVLSEDIAGYQPLTAPAKRATPVRVTTPKVPEPISSASLERSAQNAEVEGRKSKAKEEQKINKPDPNPERGSQTSNDEAHITSSRPSKLKLLRSKLDMLDKISKECRGILSELEVMEESTTIVRREPRRALKALNSSTAVRMTPPPPPSSRPPLTPLSSLHGTSTKRAISVDNQSNPTSESSLSESEDDEIGIDNTKTQRSEGAAKPSRGTGKGKRASKYRGLSKHPTISDVWRVFVPIDGQRVLAGSFNDELTAARYYDHTLRRALGPEASATKLNFPQDAASIDLIAFEPLKLAERTRGRPRKSAPMTS